MSQSGIDSDKERVVPNAVFAVVQVVATAVTLFFLYRYVVTTLGVDALGVWSLVVATTSVATVTNLGLAGSAVRFVAKHLARGDEVRAGAAVETATVSVAGAMALAALVFWPIAHWLLSLVVPPAWLGEAQSLLPLALAGFWVSSIASAVYSGLDGCHLIATRSIATIATQPLLLVLVVWWTPRLGLQGIAAAQLAQYSVWLVLGWVLLRGRLSTISRVPHRWSRSVFFEMWRYGLSFQAISILAIMLDPLAKALLSFYGGPSAVGYFEMANRMVAQVRSLIISANQVLVPYYSKVAETSRARIRHLYEKNLSLLSLLDIVMFASLVIVVPIVSRLWIGRLEPQFILYSLLLVAGWFANTLAVPAYFVNLGAGWISRNVVSHLAQSGTLAATGIIAGRYGGATGIVVAFVVSLVLGSAVLLRAFHRGEGIPLSVLFSRENALTLGKALIVSGCGFVLNLALQSRLGLLPAVGLAAFTLLTGWLVLVVTIRRLPAAARQIIASARPQ